ncbi:hypothetical protein DAEQUDRAFT_723124 [Daedalea quercina L-15889]|uniref:Uncharacterized protein n=1 Tax=Daedalea quercina L-15889 TaxID=1314783 RepID=A0A165SS67_9APHY|nr:hypothetical protein DAEQUDRAFT_723124 [Daedalea quercina L-15889]
MSYQNPQPTTADLEKGSTSSTPAPLLVPCADYQATYIVAGSTLPERRERGWARFRLLTRFLHAFFFTCLIVFFAHRLIPRLARLVNERGNSFSMHHGPVHVPNGCTFAEWTYDPNGVSPVDHFEHVAEASFELPLDSDELFFVSGGSGTFANGLIDISDDGEPGSDTAEVYILGYYNSLHHFQELTKVCRLNPEAGKNGVGIFAPQHWSGHAGHHYRTQFRIHVRLPPSTAGSPVAVNRLTTKLPFFVHHIGDLKNSIHFKELSLSTTNLPIRVDSVVVDAASAHTTNSVISGHFNTSHFLDLKTSNGPITVDIGLLNDQSGEATKVPATGKHTTPSSPVSANVSLFATTGSYTGGRFDVVAHSSNSPVRVAVPHAPADHVLTLAAHTSNSPIDLVLHPAFEGGFALHGSRWMSPQVRVDEGVEDPAGRGRRRDVSFRQVQRGDVNGVVRWLPAEEKELGLVTASTSNMGVALHL